MIAPTGALAGGWLKQARHPGTGTSGLAATRRGRVSRDGREREDLDKKTTGIVLPW